MKKIFLLVFAFVMCKLGYAQYPITQYIGTDSAVVISKGALQSRLINQVYTDTAAANLQRIRQYPGAQIVTNGAGMKIWLRNATATQWLQIPAGSAVGNIYTIDGTLTGNRELDGDGYGLNFSTLRRFGADGDSVYFIFPFQKYVAGNQEFVMRGDTGYFTKRVSYNTNLGNTFTKHSLVDKNYVDSSFSLNINGTTSYLPKYTSPNTLGTSAMYDSSGFIKLYKDFKGNPVALQNDYIANTINVDGRNGWGLLVQQNDSITNAAQIPLLLRKGLLTNDKPRPNYGTGLGMQLQDDSGAWRASSYFINRITDSTAAGFKTSMQLYLANGSGFVVPFTAYADSSIRLPKLAGSGTRYVVANSSGDLGIGTDPVTGSGTTNYVSKFNSSSSLGNSQIYDNGSFVAIGGTTSPAGNKFEVSDSFSYALMGVRGSGSTSGLQILDNGTNSGVGSPDNKDFFLYTNNNTALVIKPNGNVGISSSFIVDSSLMVDNGTHLKRGVRMSGLPSSPGTKSLRIDANGTLSIADTLIDAGGTVTSISTNNGTGITGGTITTTGTLAIDTTVISTRAWRQKGIDSVASLINTNISGTTNYVPKFTSSSAIGNSIIYEGTNAIGIGTSTPSTYSGYTTLALNNATNSGIIDFMSAGTVIGEIVFDGSGGTLKTVSATELKFGTSNQERMRIAPSGNIGIATAVPTTKLDVNGDLRVGTIANATTDTDRFIVSDGGVIKYRTGAEVLSDIGGAAASSISGTTNYIPKFTSSSAIGNSNLINDASGNLGLGVTPSAWSTGKAFEINSAGNAIWSYGTDNLYLSSNAYFNGGWKYGGSGKASNYTQFQGQHFWEIAGTGTAGNAISFTTAMTLDASGRLGIGTTSPDAILRVAGTTKIGEGAAANTSKLMVNTTNGVAAGIQLFQDGVESWIIQNIASSTALTFGNSGTERLRITGGGDVGIGTSTPGTKLEVNGAIKTAAPSGGTAKPWKLGEGNVTINTSDGKAVRVEIDGVLYYLMTASLPEPAPESAPKPEN